MTENKILSLRIKSLKGDDSYRAFAEKCDFSDASARNLAAGKDVSLSILKKVAETYNVSIGWLMGDENDAQQHVTTATELESKVAELKFQIAALTAENAELKEDKALLKDAYKRLSEATQTERTKGDIEGFRTDAPTSVHRALMTNHANKLTNEI